MKFVHDLLVVTTEESAKSVVPSVHSVDLVLVVFLSRAVSDVSLCPLGESGGDLLGAYAGIIGVVAQIVVGGASSAVIVVIIVVVIVVISRVVVVVVFWLGSSVGKLVLVVESASLVSAFEVSFHSAGVGGELGDPSFLGREGSEPIVHQLLGEHHQLVQSLERVAGRNLLLGQSHSCQKCGGKFHLQKCIKTLIEVL